MVDTVIKGTGNSRSIKAAPATLPATYDEFRAKFISPGIPIDLLGLNAAGLTTKGTDLNKANLLTDALCTALGLSTTATPTEAMEKLRQIATTAQSTADGKVKIVSGNYSGTNKTSTTIKFPSGYGIPKITFIVPYASSSLEKASAGIIYSWMTGMVFSSINNAANMWVNCTSGTDQITIDGSRYSSVYAYAAALNVSGITYWYAAFF